MRILTWFCAAVALVAMLAFVVQSWQLVLFALGVSVVAAYVAGRFTSNCGDRSWLTTLCASLQRIAKVESS